MTRQIFLILLLLINSLTYSRYYSPRERLFIMEINKGVSSWNKYISGRKLSDRWAVIMSFAKFHNKNFDNIDLAGVQFYSLSLKNVKMRKSNLQETKLLTTNIKNVDLSYSKLDRMWFSTLKAEKLQFRNVTFKDGQISGDVIFNLDIRDSILTGISIAVVLFKVSNFSRSIMKNVLIKSNTRFSAGVFSGADLSKARFVLTNEDIIHGNSKIQFFACNFTNANLTGIAQLDNAAFTYSDMNGAKIERKWFNYLKTQKVENFDKIRWQ